MFLKPEWLQSLTGKREHPKHVRISGFVTSHNLSPGEANRKEACIETTTKMHLQMYIIIK